MHAFKMCFFFPPICSKHLPAESKFQQKLAEMSKFPSLTLQTGKQHLISLKKAF